MKRTILLKENRVKAVIFILTAITLTICVLAMGYLYLFSNYVPDEFMARLLPLSILSGFCFISLSLMVRD